MEMSTRQMKHMQTVDSQYDFTIKSYFHDVHFHTFEQMQKMRLYEIIENILHLTSTM